jgi:K+-sensing histidine kinase KdpD
MFPEMSAAGPEGGAAMAVRASIENTAARSPESAWFRRTAARVAAGRGRYRLALVAALAFPPAAAAALATVRASLPAADGALILVVVVVAVAASGYRLAGVIAALSAAAWFDFFLTRPYESFTITSRANVETAVLLLVIGVTVTELAAWGRRQHGAASRRAGYLDGISAAAAAMAAGGSPSALIAEVSGQLTRLLSLRSCAFQYGVAGLGGPARLRPDGQVVAARGGAPDAPVELLVESGGLLHGRFLMVPEPGAQPEPEQRLIAVALAEQVGAALGARRPVIR